MSETSGMGARLAIAYALADEKTRQEQAMRTVSEAAVVRRIRRKLRHDYERLVKARGNARFQVARYYIVDRNNHIGAGTDDLEDWARELGCLQIDEKIR